MRVLGLLSHGKRIAWPWVHDIKLLALCIEDFLLTFVCLGDSD